MLGNILPAVFFIPLFLPQGKFNSFTQVFASIIMKSNKVLGWNISVGI